jgi:hypothetical protein
MKSILETKWEAERGSDSARLQKAQERLKASSDKCHGLITENDKLKRDVKWLKESQVTLTQGESGHFDSRPRVLDGGA